MSTTDGTVQDFRDANSPEMRNIKGMIRRMPIKLTREVKWQVLGHRLLDNKREVLAAEVFSGVGFFSRPKAGHQAESIVAFIGGAPNPVIIATRDEDAVKAYGELRADAGDLAAMFNTTTIILIKGNTVEIRQAGGTALSIPTMADFNALKAYVAAHTHPVPGVTAGAATVTSLVTASVAPTAAGTQVLKTQ